MVCVFLIICSIFDIARRKVPNWMFITGLFADALYRGICAGTGEAFIFLAAFILTQVFLAVLWLCGFFGAADIKILGIALASAGWAGGLRLIKCVLISGAVVSLFYVVKDKKMRRRILNIKKYICECICAGRLLDYRGIFCVNGEGKISFIPVITAGYILYAFYEILRG